MTNKDDALKPMELLYLLSDISALVGVASSAEYLTEDSNIEGWKQGILERVEKAESSLNKLSAHLISATSNAGVDDSALIREIAELERDILCRDRCHPLTGAWIPVRRGARQRLKRLKNQHEALRHDLSPQSEHVKKSTKSLQVPETCKENAEKLADELKQVREALEFALAECDKYYELVGGYKHPQIGFHHKKALTTLDKLIAAQGGDDER